MLRVDSRRIGEALLSIRAEKKSAAVSVKEPLLAKFLPHKSTATT